MTAEEFSAATGRPLRTVRRWFLRWFELVLAGLLPADSVTREPSPGRTGWRYTVSEEFVARYRRCEVPHPRALAG